MHRVWRNLEANKELFNKAAKSGAFIVFDTETTGLKKDDQIIEIAAYKCRFLNGAFVPYGILWFYINPDRHIPDEVTEINGITDEMVKNYPREDKAYALIKKFFGDNPVIGAYNSGFDIRMLNGLYGRNGDTFTAGLDIDLLKVARDIFCEEKMKDHKLGTIASAYGVDQGIHFHNAKDDVIVLIRVINAMIRDMNENGIGNVLETAQVFRLSYHEGYRGNSRIYVITSKGVLFYEFKSDRWGAKDKDFNLSAIDLQDVERQVFKRSQCVDYKALKKKCDSGAYTYRRVSA